MKMENQSIRSEGYLKKLQRRRSDLSNLQVRRRDKKTRLFIDNEYLERGYAKALLPSTLAVYVVLARYANARTQTCFPSIPTIMREGGIGNRNTVIAAIKRLEDHNIIVVEHSNGRRSNLYILIDTQHWKPLNNINSGTVAKERDSPPPP